MQENFLNCPLFNASSECEEMKTFVKSQEKCGDKLGEIYVIDFEFWFTDRLGEVNTSTTEP